MQTIDCQVCFKTADVPKEQGIQPDMPPRWAVVTVAQRGQPIRNTVTCPECLVIAVAIAFR